MRNPDDYVGFDAPPVTIGAIVAIELVFDRDLAPGDTIDQTFVPIWSVWLISGNDPTPSARRYASATVDATGTKTQQKIDLRGLTVGAYYGFRATVQTVAGQTLSLSSRIRAGLPAP